MFYLQRHQIVQAWQLNQVVPRIRVVKIFLESLHQNRDIRRRL